MRRFEEFYSQIGEMKVKGEPIKLSDDARAIVAALFCLGAKLDDVQHEVWTVNEGIEGLSAKLKTD